MKNVLGYIVAVIIGAAGAMYGPDIYRAAVEQEVPIEEVME